MVGTDLYNILKTITSLKVCPVVIAGEPIAGTKYLVYNLDSMQPAYMKRETKVPAVYNYTLSVYSKKYDELEDYNNQIFSLLVAYTSASISLIRMADAHDAGFNVDYGLFQRDIQITINGTIGV